MSLVQPVPEPGDEREHDRLLLEGVLVDVVGRRLTVVDCGTCVSGPWPHRIASGSTCPLALQCPTCRVPARSPCIRRSGVHRGRTNAALAYDAERVAGGDWSVPAPWPAVEGREFDPAAWSAATAHLPVQLTLSC